MSTSCQLRTVAVVAVGMMTFAAALAHAADPLPSWNDTASKKAIIAFVERVTDENAPSFVPPDERIATFDNDGTLWSEQPMYFQMAFVLDRVRVLAPQHPEWKTQEPFAAVLRGDTKGVAEAGEKGWMELLAATHAGMTVGEFRATVTEWIQTARHPKTGRLYTEMVYQPMLELLAYLRANGFKTFIVSGGGIEFMRPWTERVYGVPPEQVVGSSLKSKFELRDGVPVLVKLPTVDLIDDKAGKPVGIESHIGRRPIFAAGNSDGDLQMLQYTTIPRDDNDTTARFGLIVHHTDAVREWAYDRESLIGRLDVALDEAPQRGWLIVNMKTDWLSIYPAEDK
ncbi:MAG: haloacid dehalogenase-like hydrolase [Planctomycetaceae bacterium]|nr:haloacid dehalogenase-like hydrolase [Planctomycetaceae bacterium]